MTMEFAGDDNRLVPPTQHTHASRKAGRFMKLLQSLDVINMSSATLLGDHLWLVLFFRNIFS